MASTVPICVPDYSPTTDVSLVNQRVLSAAQAALIQTQCQAHSQSDVVLKNGESIRYKLNNTYTMPHDGPFALLRPGLPTHFAGGETNAAAAAFTEARLHLWRAGVESVGGAQITMKEEGGAGTKTNEKEWSDSGGSSAPKQPHATAEIDALLASFIEQETPKHNHSITPPITQPSNTNGKAKATPITSARKKRPSSTSKRTTASKLKGEKANPDKRKRTTDLGNLPGSTSGTLRPVESYAQLCGLAIRHLQKAKEICTVRAIYNWIETTYLYYKQADKGHHWKNCIRHNLSSKKCFIRSSHKQAHKSAKTTKCDAAVSVWEIDDKLFDKDNEKIKQWNKRMQASTHLIPQTFDAADVADACRNAPVSRQPTTLSPFDGILVGGGGFGRDGEALIDSMVAGMLHSESLGYAAPLGATLAPTSASPSDYAAPFGAALAPASASTSTSSQTNLSCVDEPENVGEASVDLATLLGAGRYDLNQTMMMRF